MEADLQQFYGVDYRDRWRNDEHGRPVLSTRRLWVLITNLPPTSRIAQTEGPHWTIEAHLLDDQRMLLENVNSDKGHTPKPHPARPQPSRHPQNDPEFKRQLARARRYARDRRRRIASGELK